MKYLTFFLLLVFNLGASQLHFTAKKLQELNSFVENNNTNAFIIYKNGSIINEKYFGLEKRSSSKFNENSYHYWASAGKSLTAVLVGIAQQKGFLSIQDKVSKYLGNNWSEMSSEQEDRIKIIHLLTMTSGLDFNARKDCIQKECLRYKNDPGKVWFYHNSSYYLLEKVLEKALKKDLNQITDEFLSSKIHLNGKWITYNDGKIYMSTAKSMLNFGILVMNKGKFKNQQVFEFDEYFSQMLNSSQDLNPSYGFLWWLNGKSSIVFPSLERRFYQHLNPFAPKDMVSALGKNGQFLDIIPSQNLIIVRMGENPSSSLIPIQFHRQLWKKISE